MTPAKITRAISEAKRFLQATDIVLSHHDSIIPAYPIAPSRETGQLRRASLDLSMALIDLRRKDK